MPRVNDGNEPHFIPRGVQQQDEQIVGGDPLDPAVYDPYNLDEICGRGFSQRVIGRLLMGMLITHFADPQRIVDDFVRPHVWTPDPDATGIHIELSTTWDSRTAGGKPEIKLIRGDMVTEPLALGDRSVIVDGRQTYANIAEGSYVILVGAQADGFVERLADEVFFMLNAQMTFLRERWSIKQFRVAGMGGPKPKQQGDHLFNIPIHVSYAYEFGWAKCTDLTPDDLQVQVNVGAEMG